MSPSALRLVGNAVRATGGYGAGAAVVALLGVATSLLLPITLAWAIDAAIGRVSGETAILAAGGLLLAATACEAAALVLEKRAGVRAALVLRRRLLQHVLALDLSGARKFGVGDLLGRTLHSATAAAGATTALVGLFTGVVTSAGGLVALVLLDPWLGVPAIVALPLVWWQARWITRRVSADTGEYQRQQGELVGRFTDSLRGARTIRAARTVDREVARVLAVLPGLHAAGLRFWLVQRTVIWQSGLVVPLGQVAVLAWAGYAALAGRIGPGEVLAAHAYFGYASGLFRQNVNLSRLARAHGAAGRLAEVLAEPRAADGTRSLPPGGGALRLRGVCADKDGHQVLEHLDLDVPAGATVAVVGASGSGKSTLTEIAGGLLAPRSGEVRLDGADLSDVRRDELRRAVAYAFERPVLLGDTLGDAVGYADAPASPAQVAAALRDGALTGFVRGLPDGTDTPLDELRPSGGELQRLGLARVLWRDARVVVLDDATSSVDTATEADITAAFARALPGRTRLVVTHRAVGAAAADLVAWLDGGRIRRLAPHADLLCEPDYRSLFGLPPVPAAVAANEGEGTPCPVGGG